MNRNPVSSLSPLSRRNALARVAAIGAALGFGSRLNRVSAQDGTGTHPLVGSWWYANDPADPANVHVAAFHADGTYVHVTGDIGTGIGVWRATGDRTTDATSIKLDTDPDRSTSAPGTVTDVVSIEVDAAGSTLVAMTTFRVGDPAGTVLFESSYTATATRIELAPSVGDAGGWYPDLVTQQGGAAAHAAVERVM